MSDYNYKCPSSGGEFDHWASGRFNSDRECPFCGKEKGDYGVSL